MTSAVPARLTGSPTPLVIECHVEAARALIVPRGELVHGCTVVLAETLAGLPAGLARIDLDMARVEFMDAAGLHFLDLLSGHGHRQSVPVTAVNWNRQPRRVLELAGLDPEDPLHTPPPRMPAPRAERVHVLEAEVEQLRQAIASRPVIDQARGVLMALHAVTPDEAWHILRETSQLSNTKLRTVAETLTASAGSGGPPPPPEIRAALRTALVRRGRA
ncbi:ANTAR domain-containing protein [Streptomyces fumanus]|uniref:ANTAR domain-containing protein n=1 Tax=Streptomyces fumanus TaxID=67302 RepID=A0A919A2H5_9ACTN|nr:ANTAR domain-containing protein [Streptomyces fumanus]GHE83541.1 hypothetical protein GCM10018772_02460 [Streptomyces fumanus]